MHFIEADDFIEIEERPAFLDSMMDEDERLTFLDGE